MVNTQEQLALVCNNEQYSGVYRLLEEADLAHEIISKL